MNNFFSSEIDYHKKLEQVSDAMITYNNKQSIYHEINVIDEAMLTKQFQLTSGLLDSTSKLEPFVLEKSDIFCNETLLNAQQIHVKTFQSSKGLTKFNSFRTRISKNKLL